MFLSMFTVFSDVPSNTLADAGADCKRASAVTAAAPSNSRRLTRAISFKLDVCQFSDTALMSRGGTS